MTRFNDWLALKITNAVSTMWCAYAFAALACITLPDAIRGGFKTFVPWCAQTFIQLVLLSIIMVGQQIQARSTIDLHDKVDSHAAQTAVLHDKVDALHDKLPAKKGGAK